ncbi:dTDP-glucose 4,6-dehydratase [Mesoterricola silvestris]|uniref:dTDP-glucose 4,6-dehydratase n=1 Tax=Mesoterricola silvestris TaxID=2927979 RepID=A0AA48GH30_9BACT|nr:dTDP-glucose 4,6-dehydratase [Mesoterricola silvestris]BDU71082.1 dTDP-glucose 4,6-dehydratase [Mesoterricola silvestris]
MSTILVTGGAGFIGSNLVHRWHRAHPEDNILVVDKVTYAADPSQIEGLPRVELIRADIQDRERVVELLDRRQVRLLFHLAAESHVDNSITGPAAFVATNLLGTFSLLEAARQVWAGDTGCRFVHVSTDEVYGALGETGAFSETTPYAPNSPYSATKAGSDHLVRAYHHTYGFPAITTNCSNNYGPRQHREKLIPLAIDRLAKGEPVPVYGDGQQVRDWLYVEDHCAALEAAALRGIPGRTYCVGGRNEWRNLELLNQLCEAVDSRLGRPQGTGHRLLTFVRDRPGHDRRYAIDSTRIRTELGWEPQVDFREGLRRTVAWYLP